ncbi:unnamed protein product [Pedinophyceae sp. YPF-701]|nr:unnamed protein product [Pedinophyceae sp. YPF-701]
MSHVGRQFACVRPACGPRTPPAAQPHHPVAAARHGGRRRLAPTQAVSGTALALAGVAVSVPALAAAAKAKNVIFEVYEGAVYVTVGVPADGPPLPEGAVELRPVPGMGRGAFATQRIPKGTKIGVYEGEFLTNEEYDARYPRSGPPPEYGMTLDRNTLIDARDVAKRDTFSCCHINHSRSRANVIRRAARNLREVQFYASRDIEADEELLFDYGKNYWQGREHIVVD